MPVIWVIVPAAGIGSRMAADVPKQYLSLAGKTVLEHTLTRLLHAQYLAGVVVALHPQDTRFATLPIAADARIATVIGGAERADSVIHALQSLAPVLGPDHWALVHDAARPCLTVAQLNRFIETITSQSGGGILAAPVADTLKRVDDRQQIIETQDRQGLWAAQTPQLFPAQSLLQALLAARAAGQAVTDEASAMEAAGFRAQVVPGPSHNFKITRPEDLPLAELILQAQHKS